MTWAPLIWIIWTWTFFRIKPSKFYILDLLLLLLYVWVYVYYVLSIQIALCPSLQLLLLISFTSLRESDSFIQSMNFFFLFSFFQISQTKNFADQTAVEKFLSLEESSGPEVIQIKCHWLLCTVYIFVCIYVVVYITIHLRTQHCSLTLSFFFW